MIIPLKQLEKLCLVVYKSTCNRGAFICRTKDGDVVLKSNGKDMPYLNLREFKAKAVLSFAPKAACLLCRQCEGIWRDSPGTKSRKCDRPSLFHGRTSQEEQY